MNNNINYLLSIESPSTHYCNIDLKFQHTGGRQTVSIPVWTPGSYLIREFARFVSHVKCVDSNGNNTPIQKINKNTWEFDSPEGEVKISYKVYCNDNTVRSSVINDQRVFLNGSNLFMKVDGFENSKHIVKFKFSANWNHISTGLYNESENVYYHNNYDDFIDCPIEIGNQNITEFEVNGVKHYISVQGKGNLDQGKLTSEIKTIVETQTKFFEDIPYDFYVFLLSLEESGYGGLEHKNSFAAIYPKWEFGERKSCLKFLGLISHEFFHLWNVKRIRPVELGPFDYGKENYTISHWVTEGWTSFYDNLFLHRAELADETEYLSMVEREVNEVMHYTGHKEMSLTESSFDNWIKFYRKHENTRNDQISYYTKGALIATVLNIEIIRSSNYKNSLDNVLLDLWQDYKNDPEEGYTQKRVKELCEQATGKNLDDFWKKYIFGTAELPLDKYFGYAGYELVNKNKDKVSLDVMLKNSSENVFLEEVYKGGSAYEAGLQSGDEILSINGHRINIKILDKILSSFKVNDKVSLLLNRNGYIVGQDLVFLDALPEYEIKILDNISPDQKKVKEKWLNG